MCQSARRGVARRFSKKFALMCEYTHISVYYTTTIDGTKTKENKILARKPTGPSLKLKKRSAGV